MTYTFDCDGWCGREGVDARPALTGEFNEDWYKADPAGDLLKDQGYRPGDLVTLCGDCVQRLLLEVQPER